MRESGSLWWPREVRERATSPADPLRESLSRFLEVLSQSSFGESPKDILTRAKKSKLHPNIFLKHSCVLADFGGETIQRVSGAGAPFFLTNTQGYGFLYLVAGSEAWLSFSEIGQRRLSNGNLHLETKNLFAPTDLILEGMCDITGWLYYGRSAKDHNILGLAEDLLDIDLGQLLGKPIPEIERLITGRYLDVSRQTQGSNSNQNGQILQDLVKESLEKTLGKQFKVERNGKIEINGEEDSFDVVVTRDPAIDGRSVGIEVAFQVTTNSVIERKSRQAEGWKEKLAPDGHALAFLVDGAGNLFERAAAVGRICNSVDCVVTFSETGLEALADFVRKSLA